MIKRYNVLVNGEKVHSGLSWESLVRHIQVYLNLNTVVTFEIAKIER